MYMYPFIRHKNNFVGNSLKTKISYVKRYDANILWTKIANCGTFSNVCGLVEKKGQLGKFAYFHQNLQQALIALSPSSTCMYM